MSNIYIEMLLSQLSWPVPLTRHFAAKEIAKLLKDNQKMQSAFLTWLKGRTLEVEVAAGLGIVAMAGGKECFKYSQLRKHIKRPSLLSDMYLSDIYKKRIVSKLDSAHSGSFPSNFERDKKFRQRSLQYIAGIFGHSFEDFESNTGLPFLTHWAWEYSCIMNAEQHYSPSPDYFMDSDNRWNSVGSFQLRETDILQSAYLRTLSYAVVQWKMPRNQACFNAMFPAPLNAKVGKWEPQEKPAVWPGFDEASDFSRLLDPATLTEELNRILVGADEVLVSASAPIIRSKNISADMEVTSLAWERGIGLDHKSFLEFETPDYLTMWEEEFSPGENLPGDIKYKIMEEWEDMLCVPLSFNISNFNPRWQMDWLSRCIFWPAPYFFEDFPRAEYTNEGIIFKIEDQIIGRFFIWHDEWKPSRLKGLGQGVGCALVVSRHILEKWLKSTNSDFSMLAHLRYLKREKDYGEYESGDIKAFSSSFSSLQG